MTADKVGIEAPAAGRNAAAAPPRTVRLLLFGAEAQRLEQFIEEYDTLELVADAPDIVVCYGGDGTLLAAELAWPGLPKVPILNSRTGHRCLRHPPAEVFERLAEDRLVHNEYPKLECRISTASGGSSDVLTPLNEINVQKGRINSAVRYRVSINEVPYEEGREILGDGFVICTAFGSTAYFSKITRGVFNQGIGLAFMATPEHINHVILPEDAVIRLAITRGPAVLAYDCASRFVTLESGDELMVQEHPHGATILTCDPVTRLDEPF